MEAAAADVGHATMVPEGWSLEEGCMVQEDRWREVHRLYREERAAIAEIARRLDLDRKTVRRCLRQERWQPYSRPVRTDTLLAEHVKYLEERAPQVRYSAQVLFQELRRRGYRGGYDTVRRFVQPLRAAEVLADRAAVRFETPPGHQSQIDWGTARVPFRHQTVVLHLFVLTLGFSRRGFMEPCEDEQLPHFLDAHEKAFEHFGGYTQEHLYDRARTVCRPDGEGGVIWNSTFKSFAGYWGFEPRVCRPYRAQTKGKVESGVKYVKRNFLAGRSFVDLQDVREQWAEWNAAVSDVRVHGTTHQRPIDRFAEERAHLNPRGSRPGYRLEARFARIVADDYLVSMDTNRYSVPFLLIGQTVDVERRGGEIRIFHRGCHVISHPELPGRHQVRILPEHGPGAIARNGRKRRSSVPATAAARLDDVEARDLAAYEALLETDLVGSPQSDDLALPRVRSTPATSLPALAGRGS
jgi:transposase